MANNIFSFSPLNHGCCLFKSCHGSNGRNAVWEVTVLVIITESNHINMISFLISCLLYEKVLKVLYTLLNSEGTKCVFSSVVKLHLTLQWLQLVSFWSTVYLWVICQSLCALLIILLSVFAMVHLPSSYSKQKRHAALHTSQTSCFAAVFASVAHNVTLKQPPNEQWHESFRSEQEHRSTTHMPLGTGSVFAEPFTFADALLMCYFWLCHHIWALWQRDLLQKNLEMEEVRSNQPLYLLWTSKLVREQHPHRVYTSLCCQDHLLVWPSVHPPYTQMQSDV